MTYFSRREATGYFLRLSVWWNSRRLRLARRRIHEGFYIFLEEGELSVVRNPKTILMVENYASFNRQVREIDDGSLVVYTGGFPSTGVVEVVSKVLRAVPGSIPFFHWGDIDVGGLRIFRYLEESLPRRPQAHLMNQELAEKFGRDAEPDPSLGSIAKSDSGISALAHWLAFGTGVRHLEQEAIEPQSPASQ